MLLRVFVIVFLYSIFSLEAQDLLWEAVLIEKHAISGEEKVVATFSFKNDAKASVDIRSLKTSCGCTTAELSKKRYEAGESGEVKVVFDPGARKGRQEKVIIVETDADKYMLTLRVQIPEAIVLEPRKLSWKLGEPAGIESVHVTILEKHAKIKSVQSMSSDFEATLVEVVPQKDYRIDVRAKTTERRLQKIVRVEVADPTSRTLFLPVQVQ